jgi:hypothetical protein
MHAACFRELWSYLLAARWGRNSSSEYCLSLSTNRDGIFATLQGCLEKLGWEEGGYNGVPLTDWIFFFVSELELSWLSLNTWFSPALPWSGGPSVQMCTVVFGAFGFVCVVHKPNQSKLQNLLWKSNKESTCYLFVCFVL